MPMAQPWHPSSEQLWDLRQNTEPNTARATGAGLGQCCSHLKAKGKLQQLLSKELEIKPEKRSFSRHKEEGSAAVRIPWAFEQSIASVPAQRQCAGSGCVHASPKVLGEDTPRSVYTLHFAVRHM